MTLYATCEFGLDVYGFDFTVYLSGYDAFGFAELLLFGFGGVLAFFAVEGGF
jgi:hypothetical protein